MTKKGNWDANVPIGELIETFVIESEDLVQVVVKGILLPADGVSCKDIVGSIPSLECADRGVKVKKSNRTSTDRMQTSRIRQVGDGRAQGRPVDYKGKADVEKIEIMHEVLSLVLSVDTCSTQSKVDEMHQDTASKLLSNGALSDCSASSLVKINSQSEERHNSEVSSCRNYVSLGVSTSGNSFVEGSPESVVGSSSTPTEMVPPKCTSSVAKIIGHRVGSRTHPNGFVSQHHSIQAGPAYMQTNSQNVMVGRLGGQLVYMHPVTHDVNQEMSVFSQVVYLAILC